MQALAVGEGTLLMELFALDPPWSPLGPPSVSPPWSLSWTKIWSAGSAAARERALRGNSEWKDLWHGLNWDGPCDATAALSAEKYKAGLDCCDHKSVELQERNRVCQEIYEKLGKWKCQQKYLYSITQCRWKCGFQNRKNIKKLNLFLKMFTKCWMSECVMQKTWCKILGSKSDRKTWKVPSHVSGKQLGFPRVSQKICTDDALIYLIDLTSGNTRIIFFKPAPICWQFAGSSQSERFQLIPTQWNLPSHNIARR